MVPFDTEEGMYNLDLDPEGHVVGLEVLNAGKRLPPAFLKQAQEQTDNE